MFFDECFDLFNRLHCLRAAVTCHDHCRVRRRVPKSFGHFQTLKQAVNERAGVCVAAAKTLEQFHVIRLNFVSVTVGGVCDRAALAVFDDDDFISPRQIFFGNLVVGRSLGVFGQQLSEINFVARADNHITQASHQRIINCNFFLGTPRVRTIINVENNFRAVHARVLCGSQAGLATGSRRQCQTRND